VWCSSRSSTRKFNHVLAIDHVYGGINFLTYFYILATSFRTHSRIITLKKKLVIFLVFKIKNHLLMLMVPFDACKIVEIHHQKKHPVTSLIFILMFSKKIGLDL